MITGIVGLKFGVEDRRLSSDFIQNFGLQTTISDLEGSDLYLTRNASRIYVFDLDHPDLAPAIESGSTLREVIWGVAQPQDLLELAQRLADVEGFSASAERVCCRDPNGMSLSFVLNYTQQLDDVVSAGINQYGKINRINQASPVYQRAEPISVGHVVFFSPNLAAVQQFYIDKLGFYLSDAYNDRGAFLRCRGEGFHHDLFLLKLPHRPQPGLNHVAFVVRDIHEVIGGGINMNRQKWSSFIGPGRHPISSAYFWYVHSPLGGAFEYYSNDDYLTEAWQPRFVDYAVELFTEWAVDGGVDSQTRRQMIQS
jgi:catechol 2,3-dioxygenase-like lactoylglutathione lyase family enzyme